MIPVRFLVLRSRATFCFDAVDSFSFLQSTSRVTSISENEMNIRIPLCNVQHLIGMLNISVEIFPKKSHYLIKKKNSKYLGNNCYS